MTSEGGSGHYGVGEREEGYGETWEWGLLSPSQRNLPVLEPSLSQGGEVLPTCTSAAAMGSCGEPLTLLSLFLQHKQGKVGPDGKELIPQESPRVGGFGFVATPSPAPGKKQGITQAGQG